MLERNCKVGSAFLQERINYNKMGFRFVFKELLEELKLFKELSFDVLIL